MLREKPKKKLALQIAPNAVTTDKIAPYAVTPDKIHPDVIKIWDDIAKGAELGGVALLNEFGNSIYFGVSQKTLTEAFYRVWSKFEEITGEVLQGISMTVTPSYFISEYGCDVHISANTVDANGIFEEIRFYINGIQVFPEHGHEDDGKNVSSVSFDTSVDDTSVVTCVAKIMGIEYMREKTITHYNSFWLGAGSTYTSIMDVNHVIPIKNGMRGAYDVTVLSGQHIIIVVGESLREGFYRADINGVEIPFNETSVTVNGNRYRVFTSVDTFEAGPDNGKYNIDING